MKNKEEDYLDNLLNSISEQPLNGTDTRQSKHSDLFKTPEGDFLKEFEAELGSDEDSDYLREFEMELDADENQDLDPYPKHEQDASEMTLDDIISGAKDHMDDLDENSDDFFEEEEEKESVEPEKEDIPEEPDLSETSMQSEQLDLSDDGEVDLSGNREADILDILAGDGDLSDLGKMLSDDENADDNVESSEIDEFAQKEMEQSAKEQEAEPKAEEEQDNKKKKPGFLAKLGKLLFGEGEENQEDVLIKESDETDLVALSEENMQILKEMDEEGEAIAKKEAKKKKKEKKEKKPKEKKAKKPKKEKVKKEKKPKEVDLTPPLPKIPVILIFVMVSSLMILVLLLTNMAGYQSKVKEANIQYARGNYCEAYEDIKGLSLKEKDEQLLDKLSILAAVSSEYDAYETFASGGKNTMALDSLVCAQGRYRINMDRAKEVACEQELNQLEVLIKGALEDNYQMTAEEAEEIYSMRDRKEYTKAIQNKIKALGLD